MPTIDTYKLTVNIIVLIIGALIIKGLARGMTPIGKKKGFGTALFFMIVWFGIYFVIQYFEVDVLLIGTLGIIGWVILVVGFWLLFSLLIKAFYGGSFGRCMGIAILFALILFLLLWVVGAILVFFKPHFPIITI
ncbi:MAG: hypothetical protein ACFFCS_29375 [Candidatus Hodarchaeota archaeon]